MRRVGLLLSAFAWCAGCSLTTSLEGYMGPPLDEPATDAPSNDDATPTNDGGPDPDDATRDDLVVTSLSLVTAATGNVVPGYEDLVDGMNVPPPFTNWTVRAEVTGGPGSVEFTIDGQAFNIENNAPFYLCADSSQVIEACDLSSGDRVLRVTPWSSSDATGTHGATVTLTLKVP